jgi:glycosyltransferase involved in cell wall biosynthesis
MHDCWAYTGHCSYYSFVECDKWETHCESCPQLNKYPKSLGLDNSYGNFELKKVAFRELPNLLIVTPSHWLSGEISRSILKEYPIQVIHNGIDLNFFKRKKGSFRKSYGLESKKIILGVASVWDNRKGLYYFKEISKLLNENEVIVLVGIELTGFSNIISIKRTNDIEELVNIYSSADVFFNPTLEDNFPTVNLEAMACGTPVITFDSGGSKESIFKEFGLVINKQDPHVLIGLIRDFLEKKQEIESLQTHIKINFSKTVMIEKYIHHYGRVHGN